MKRRFAPDGRIIPARLAPALLFLVAGFAACRPSLTQEVSIPGSVGRLDGEIQRPAKAAAAGRKLPVTIILHGLTGNRNEDHIRAVSDSLLAHGIATVRFDFNGHGTSEGRFSDMSLDNELADAQAIYNYVAGLPWVDSDRISVAGHSQGGLLAGLLAGVLGKDRIHAAVLLAPAACLYTMAQENRLFDTPLDPADLPDSISLWGDFHVGRAYLLSARDCDAYRVTARYDGPVRLIQGLEDTPEILRGALGYLDWLPQLDYIPLPGLTHCFPEDLATPARLTAEFITEQ